MRTVSNLKWIVILAATSLARGAERPVIDLWPGTPPGDEARELPPEADTTTPEAKLVAGRRVMRIGHVSRPTLEVFRPEAARNTGAAVVICPGGGHSILAYDLEGTEVAEWLNTLGVTGIVLKYRVPGRQDAQGRPAFKQDVQRAVRLVRSRASDWQLDPARIGVCGFSAGGETAAWAALVGDAPQYDRRDAVDDVSGRPDFCICVYAGGMVDRADPSRLRPEVVVPPRCPPFFLVHAQDDRVPVENSVRLYLALKQAGVPAELHVYDRGGHGYGLRPTEQPVTHWPARCADWLRAGGWLAGRAGS